MPVVILEVRMSYAVTLMPGMITDQASHVCCRWWVSTNIITEFSEAYDLDMTM